jgi:hypothetical protein
MAARSPKTIVTRTKTTMARPAKVGAKKGGKKDNAIMRRFEQEGVHYFKIRYVGTMTSDAGGQIQAWLNDDVSGYQDWSSLAALFDSYRVYALKLQFVPDLPNDTSTVTGYKPLYVIHDVDSSNVPGLTVSVAIQYENCKIYNMYRPWEHKTILAEQTSSGVASQGMLPGGFKDIATTTASQCVTWTGTGFDVSTTYGTLVSTAYVMFKNRR